MHSNTLVIRPPKDIFTLERALKHLSQQPLHKFVFREVIPDQELRNSGTQELRADPMAINQSERDID